MQCRSICSSRSGISVREAPGVAVEAARRARRTKRCRGRWWRSYRVSARLCRLSTSGFKRPDAWRIRAGWLLSPPQVPQGCCMGRRRRRRCRSRRCVVRRRDGGAVGEVAAVLDGRVGEAAAGVEGGAVGVESFSGHARRQAPQRRHDAVQGASGVMPTVHRISVRNIFEPKPGMMSWLLSPVNPSPHVRPSGVRAAARCRRTSRVSPPWRERMAAAMLSARARSASW